MPTAMIYLHEVHEVLGGKMEEFSDALRTRWRPLLEEDGQARLLWYWELTHGTGPSYQAVSIAAVRDWTTWGTLAESRRARDWQREACALRREVTAKILLPTPWSPLPEPDLTPILNLVLFLLVYKLFHRRSNRDYLQLYILSFLVVLAGAWLAQTVMFVVGFATYVVLATWTLILFHLRHEIEDNYLVKHLPEAGSEKVTAARVLNSRRVVGRSFFLSTGYPAGAMRYSVTFTKAGTYNYLCLLHPRMVGSVVVA